MSRSFSANTSRRVVVTGMGAITALGLDVETLWRNLLAGESGIGAITRFDARPFTSQIAAEVKDFDPTAYIPKKEARRMDRFIQFALAASLQAVEQAQLTVDAHNAADVGVIIGSALGGLESLDKAYQVFIHKGPRRISPFTGVMMISNMAAGQVAITLGARGPNFCPVSACATGSHAIGEAYEMIRRGDAQVMLAGGSEAALVPIGFATFDRLGALSQRNDEPKRAMRPFDAERDGFVVGEGAAIIILENLEYAEKRGATPLAEIVGYALNDDAHHVTAPSPDGAGAVEVMHRALEKAGLEPTQIDYINAHGTSTPLNDKSETAAIKRVFGEHAYRVPISSTKSMVGHLLGAAGAVEAVACVKTLQTGRIHPTANYEYPDPDCDLDYVPNAARQANVTTALSNSFGFGGHNAVLVFGKSANSRLV